MTRTTTTSLPRLAWRAFAVLQMVAVVIVVVLGCALLAGTLPSLLGDESFVVAQQNMEPALQVGDLAVVAPVKAGGLAVGDIITYRTPPELDYAATRRIIFIDTDAESGHLSMQTRGDSDPTAEQISVTKTTVLGRLVFGIPRLGVLVSFANQTAGKLTLIGLPILLLTADWLRVRARRRRTAAGVSLEEMTRIQSLLDSGHRALSAGFPQLAARAADGILGIDPHNEAAVMLMARAIEAREADREHVAA
jgi:signal peptidase I